VEGLTEATKPFATVRQISPQRACFAYEILWIFVPVNFVFVAAAEIFGAQ